VGLESTTRGRRTFGDQSDMTYSTWVTRRITCIGRTVTTSFCIEWERRPT
jgi:hypothetical protein